MALAAAAALVRPGRSVVLVGSLSLWRQALQSQPAERTRFFRRLPKGWVLLLLGATLAILTLAGPTAGTSKPIRHVAVGLYLSAEFVEDSQGLYDAAYKLLNRLQPDDQVQLLVPDARESDREWQTVAQARKTLSGWQKAGQKGLRPASQISLPPADEKAQLTVFLAPAGTQLTSGPNVNLIEVPYRLPPVTFDVLAAEPLDSSRMETFVCLRNHTDWPWNGSLEFHPEGIQKPAIQGFDVRIEPRGTWRKSVTLPAQKRLAAVVIIKSGQPVVEGYLDRRQKPAFRVALIGPEEPVLRQYIAADSLVETVASVSDADLVIANRVAPPANKPALVICPPQPPPGWRIGRDLRDAALDKVDIEADDTILQYVNLSGVFVRTVRPWVAGDTPTGKPLALLDGQAILWRSTPQREAEQPSLRQVFIAFDLGPENTNLSAGEPFVILLANAVRWLGQNQREVGEKYVFSLTPASAELALGLSGNWRFLPLGLRQTEPSRPPAQAIQAVKLPNPVGESKPTKYWPWPAVAAVLCWMAGWARQIRAASG